MDDQQAHYAAEQARLQGDVEAAFGAIWKAIRTNRLESQFTLACWAAGVQVDVVKAAAENLPECSRGIAATLRFIGAAS